jgi:putative hemolysin
MSLLLAVIGASLAVSFVCSILEAVLLSTSHSYVAVLEGQGHRAGRLLARMRRNIEEPIAAILTLNTIAHTVGAAIGGALALQVFGSRWIAAFSVVLTLAILVFSEIIPKTIGALYWQSLAPATAYVLRALILVMRPILVPLAALNRLLTPRGQRRRVTVSRAELEVLAEIGRSEGTIDQEEYEVVTNVMNLDRVRVDSVLTPRTSIVAVPIDADLDTVKAVMAVEGHLRLPVYEGDLDTIRGIVLARDVLRAEHEGVRSVVDIMRPPHFVPATKVVEDLIRDMRALRIKMAIVLDEFGGTAGLVTLEDLIEEIVGEIRDEHDVEEAPDFEARDGAVWIAGGTAIEDVNVRLGLELPAELYATIGGYVFGELGRVATVGDAVVVPGGRFRVLAVEGRRIGKVAFEPIGEGGRGSGSIGE